MSDVSKAPDLSALDIPMDAYTQPFWEGTADGKLLLPRCGACARFRWPPGPFCPHCRSQETEWRPAGEGKIYSFTIVRDPRDKGSEPGRVLVPALIEFPGADGVRIPAAIVDAALAEICIGAPVYPGWLQAANAKVPVFSVAQAAGAASP